MLSSFYSLNIRSRFQSLYEHCPKRTHCQIVRQQCFIGNDASYQTIKKQLNYQLQVEAA